MTDGHGGVTATLIEKVRQALLRSGFAAPDAGEACTLFFDTNEWQVHGAHALDLLDAGERNRAARFRFDADRATYVLAHALWRIALGECLRIDAAAVPLASTPAGQPRLRESGMSTSLSHSGSWVAIAIACAPTVGVDIERSPPRMALDDLLTVICSPAEAVGMQRLPGDEREAALLSLWTRKEALLKAFGIGLAQALHSLSVLTDGLISPSASVTDQVPCRVIDLDLPTGLVGALAIPANVRSNRIIRLGVTSV